MGFRLSPLAFAPGLFANRSTRASQQRWVDGDLVRFRDEVPEQIGGWQSTALSGDAMTGFVRDLIAWRPNSQIGRYIGAGSETGYFLLGGGSDVSDLTPVGFVTGRPDTLVGAGYGASTYGADTYGTIRDVGALRLDASIWSSDMFGEVLLTCFNGDEKIYDFLLGTDTVLQEVVGITGRAICVSDERHLFVFGADGEPNAVKWSDRDDYTVFTPSATNRAGGYDMAATSAFQCGRRVRGYVLGWTETEVFGFYPLNNSLVYGRERLSTNAGACGPQSVAVVTDNTGSTAYWIGPDNFYLFDGAVREIECELRDYVFSDINREQRAKFTTRTNSRFSEVWFFYASADSIEIDRAVVLNYGKGIWYKAGIARTSWLDVGIFDKPLAFAPDRTLYEHEVGETADGVAMTSYVTSHPITIGLGQQFADIDGFWPDMAPGSADCEVTFIARDYHGGPDTEYGPYSFAVTDEKIDLSLSARQFQLKISSELGYWELGAPVVSVQGSSLR